MREGHTPNSPSICIRWKHLLKKALLIYLPDQSASAAIGRDYKSIATICRLSFEIRNRPEGESLHYDIVEYYKAVVSRCTLGPCYKCRQIRVGAFCFRINRYGATLRFELVIH